jgi:predicted transcriptional regulator
METKKAVGRPISKENRKKVGFSLEGVVLDELSKLAAMTGKTQSRIVEEAIMMFKEKEDIINARIKKIEELGDDAFLDIDKLIEKRLKREDEILTNMEARNVG